MPYHDYLHHDDLVVVASHVPLKDAHALPPRHVGRLLDVLPPTDSSASSASSSRGASSAAPLSTLPPSSAALPHELEKLARALQACRAALEQSEESASEDDFDEDESLDSEEVDDDEELESEYLDDDENDQMSEVDAEPAPKPDDSYHRRMRRICLWREQLACSAPSSLKRKAESELQVPVQAQNALSASPKRARLSLAPAHVCAACGWSFPTQNTLAAHGTPANPNEACRAAVAYQLEA